MPQGCGNSTKQLVVLTGFGDDGRTLVTRGIHPIHVSQTVVNDQDIRTFTYEPDLPFSGQFAIDYIDTNPSGASYKNGVLALKGVEVVRVDLSWDWSRDEVSVDLAQNLDNTSYPITTKSHSYTGLTLVYTDGTSNDPAVEDRRFIITASDGEESLTLYDDADFGNRIYYGEGLYSEDEPTVIALVTGVNFDSVIRSNATGFTYAPTSLSPAVFPYIAVPVGMGSLEFII